MSQQPTSLGTFYSWWRGDVLPSIPALDAVTVTALAELLDVPSTVTVHHDTARLIAVGNRLYIATIESVLVAHGWNATSEIAIGELGIERELPARNRYLWGFVTDPAWRGRKLYPRLLQAIMQDDHNATRFWIGHEPGNDASARGILTAGFSPVGEVLQDGSGDRWLIPSASAERANACVDVFGIPIR